jgi:hypothetical protein
MYGSTVLSAHSSEFQVQMKANNGVSKDKCTPFERGHTLNTVLPWRWVFMPNSLQNGGCHIKTQVRHDLSIFLKTKGSEERDSKYGT